MKTFFTILFISGYSLLFSQAVPKTQNIILVTWDGFRWQELFDGADKRLIKKKKFVRSPGETKKEFWSDDVKARREKLTPFIWNTMAMQGVVIGNRHAGCRMQVTNPYNFSYPGYNEIFSGFGDKRVNSNDYPDNPNINLFDVLQESEAFKGEAAAFATWDAFPRIINSKRNGVPVYVDFKTENGATTCADITISNWKTSVPRCRACSETDTMTYHFAKEYLQRHHPRFAFIGFDETDHFGHEGEYDSYLQTARMLDSYLQDLWNFIQNDEHYRNNTTLIVTTDHGRGHGTFWRHHARVLPRSKQIWFAAMGNGIKNEGELKKKGDYYQNQIAATICALAGLQLKNEKAGKPLDIILK